MAMYNFKQPPRVSSLLYMINGKPVNSKINTVVDFISVFGIVCGVSLSLGTGTMQMAAGLNIICGIEETKLVWLIVEVVVVAGFLLMSIGGIRKGIKIVTDQNLRLYIIILAVVTLVGPTLYIFDMFVESNGLTFGKWFENITYTGGIDGNERALNWQIWQWISVACFSPITGLFFAKISYGRTLREIAIGTSLIPSVFVSIWFTVFGSYAFHLQSNGILDLWGKMEEQGMQATMFELFRTLPGGMIWCVVFMVVIYISFVTLASSATTSAGFVTTTIDRPVREDEEPPMWIKCTWAGIMAACAYIFISFAGIDGAKAISNIGGMPVMLFSAIVAYGVWQVRKRLKEYDERCALNPDLESETEAIEGTCAEVCACAENE
jgi:glycine betaine transporter